MNNRVQSLLLNYHLALLRSGDFFFSFFNFFKFLILPGCSFKCYHLFSHEAQGRNVPNSSDCEGWVFIAHIRDDHQNLKLVSIDLKQMHLIGLVERTILVFKSSKSDVSLQSYGL